MIVRFNVAFHGPHQAASNGEPQTRASGRRIGGAVKFIEHMVLRAQRQTRAVIAHAQLQPALRQSGVDFDLGARRCIQRGIVQHIAQHLGEQAAVEHHQGQIIGATETEQMLAEFLLQRRGGGVEHVADLTPVGAWLQRLGLDAGHLQKVLHDALESAIGRFDLRREGIPLAQAIQSGANDGDGRFQFMRHAVQQRAVQPLGLREEFGAMLCLQQLLTLGVVLLQRGLTFPQSCDEMPHAQRHDEEHGKHDDVLRLLDVQRELRRDEDEIPHQRTHHAHRQHRPAIPPRAREHDGHQKHQRGEKIARVRQQHPARRGQHKEDRQPPAKLPHHGHRHGLAGFGRGGVVVHAPILRVK